MTTEVGVPHVAQAHAQAWAVLGALQVVHAHMHLVFPFAKPLHKGCARCLMQGELFLNIFFLRMPMDQAQA